MAPYDVIGNIVLVKFDRDAKAREKKKWAEKFLKEHKQVRTVREKSHKISGRLRTPTTKWIAGEKTSEAIYKENGCEIRLNIDTCYFSPRLATDRLDVAKKVKSGERVLVMFGGVAPFALTIAKHSKAKEVVTVELGREPSRYAKENVRRNKLSNVLVVQGDVRKVLPKLLADARRPKVRGATKLKTSPTLRSPNSFVGFDRIIMARPNLKDSFLDVAFSVLKRGGRIHYHGFYPESEKKEMIDMIKNEAKKARRKIRIIQVKKAGEVGVKTFRYRVDLKITN